MPITQPKKNSGFTIIEMLIVVTILSMLAGILIPVLEGEASNARDARRAADLRTVSAALANYYALNDNYPDTGDTWFGDAPTYGNMGYDSAGYIPGLVPNYIAALPKDPDQNFPNATDKGYMYRSDGQHYKFVIDTAQTSFYISNPFYDPTRPITGWQVSSPGGYDW
jgi:prepilin-type N-terminal cleavage/methylation domain-containing protein